MSDVRFNTKYKFSDAGNLAHIRVCFKGEIKEEVAALLYTATDPVVIMNTLEQCFGRLELIVERTMEEESSPSQVTKYSLRVNILDKTRVIYGILY